MSKTSKQELKDAIDGLPQTVLQRLFRFIQSLKEPGLSKQQIKTFPLKGRFDNVDVRSRAYD